MESERKITFAEIYKAHPPPSKRKIVRPKIPRSDQMLNNWIFNVFLKPVGKPKELVHPNVPFVYREEPYWDE